MTEEHVMPDRLNGDFTDEMERCFASITERDQIILEYLLDKVLYDFMVGDYDTDYKIPYTRG